MGRNPISFNKLLCSIALLYLLLFIGGFENDLQAQSHQSLQTETLRKQLGIPAFDALLNLNPVQRTLFLDKSINQIGALQPDSIAMQNLVSEMQEFAKEQNSQDLELIADLLSYYGTQMYENTQQQINTLSKLHLKAIREEVVWFRLEVDILLANAYIFEKKNYESGLFLQRDLAGIVEKIDDQLCPRKQQVYFELGVSYHVFNDQLNAVSYLQKALLVNPPNGIKNDRVRILNHLALSYRELNLLDSSDIYFKANLKITQDSNFTAYKFITLGNLGENQYLRKNYDAALPLLQADADMALKLNDFFLASNALLLIGDIHSRKGNYQKAETYLMQGLRILHGYSSFPKRKKCYSIMERYYINTNQNKLASLYQDSLLYVNDSLERYYNQSRISSSESQFEYQNLKEKAMEEATSNKLSRFILIGILIFIVLLLLIGFQYFQRHKALANMRQMKLQLSLQHAESNLEDARAKLDAYLKNLSSQNESEVNWTESRILTQTHWKEFQVLFNDSYPGFISRLKENLPQITDGEIRFCCLMRLQLKVKQIALILGVNENSAYKNRSRLLAKLELTDELALVDLLFKI